MEPQYDVFISHSSKDKTLADVLWKELEKRGHRCWIAPNSIRPSEKWPDAIRRGVGESKILVLLFNTNSEASDEVETELFYAKKKFSIPIVSIRLENIEAERLEHFIWSVQWISAVNPPLIEQLDEVSEQIEWALKKERDKVVVSLPEPKPELEHDVFISYSFLNQGFADTLYDRFKAADLRVWMDQDGIPGGADSEAALQSSRLMLLIVSQPSMKDENVKNEIGRALEQNTPILKVEFTALKSGTAYPPQLDAAPSIDAKSGASPDKLEEIVQKTRAMLQVVELLPAIEPVKPTRDASRQRDRSHREVVNALSAENKSDVFISSTTRDSKFSDALYKALQATQFQVWMARTNLTEDSNSDEQVEAAIQNARLMLLVISKASMKSWNVQREIAIAAEQGVPILPVQIEELETNTFRPLPLQESRWIDARENQSPRKFHEIVAATRQLLDETAPQESDDSSSTVSPLQAAMTFRGPKEGRIFAALREGATDVGVRDRLGKTALHYAVGKQDVGMVRLLLERKADVNAQDKRGTTPLHLAVPDVSLTRLLMMNGGDSNIRNQAGKTPYDLAVEARATNTIYLLDLWLKVKEGTTNSNDALIEACGLNSWKSQRILNAIAAGASDDSVRDPAGRTAMHWAAQENEPELVELLLNKGADFRARDKKGSTPADLARERGLTEIEEQLRVWEQSHAAPRVPDPKPELTEANQALQMALLMKSSYKYNDILHAILGGATDFSLTDAAGRTALHWAARSGHVKAVKLALANGADVNATSTKGETPLVWAQATGSPGTRVINLLKQHGGR